MKRMGHGTRGRVGGCHVEGVDEQEGIVGELVWLGWKCKKKIILIQLYILTA